jgi:hypothetical protein
VRLMSPRPEVSKLRGLGLGEIVYIRFDNDLECNALHLLNYIISY